MHNKKWFTWFLITAILLLPLPALFRYLQTFIVRNAVVTAHLYDVHAPIEGVVATLDARPGTISAHSPLVVLQSTRLPQADIDILEARYHERCQTHEFLQQEFDEINIRLSNGHHKLSEYRTMLQQDLDQTADILKARLDGEEDPDD